MQELGEFCNQEPFLNNLLEDELQLKDHWGKFGKKSNDDLKLK